MQLASREQTRELLEKANDWYEHNFDVALRGKDERLLVKIAVAEYIANQEQLTLFRHNKSLKKTMMELDLD